MAVSLHALLGWMPFDAFSQASIQQFLSLVLIAMACILMGAGLPTTALYIMLVSVAQPALSQLGIPPLATHMFVLYYGLISEITPPVCASAYAAAGIANANPFRTGINAFTLGIGKLMVPMVFVYAPTMLIVLPEYFTLTSFLQVSITCAIGVFAIATAVSGYFAKPLNGLLAAVNGRWRVTTGGAELEKRSYSPGGDASGHTAARCVQVRQQANRSYFQLKPLSVETHAQRDTVTNAISATHNQLDVAIVGGGIVGICTALSLQASGLKVAIVERDEPGQSTSYGNAGVISPWSNVPQSVPGLWRKIPYWLLHANGPVSIKPSYALRFFTVGAAVHAAWQ